MMIKPLTDQWKKTAMIEPILHDTEVVLIHGLAQGTRATCSDTQLCLNTAELFTQAITKKPYI